MDTPKFLYDDGYPIVDLDSDHDDHATSSEDDLDIILHGTPEQKRRLRRRSLGIASSSSEDDFEKIMEMELNNTLKQMHGKGNNDTTAVETGPMLAVEGSPSTAAGADSSKKSKESGGEQDSNTNPPDLSNEDLLYDPDIDEANQRWVDARRQTYQAGTRGRPQAGAGAGAGGAPQRLPQSDAVLNCPACMSLLCLDCQRHAVYTHQYRAMFVTNCAVDRSERLRFPVEEAKKSKKQQLREKRRQKKAGFQQSRAATGVAAQTLPSDVPAPPGTSSQAAGGENLAEMTSPEESGMEASDVTGLGDEGLDAESYHPVRCEVCTSEVGVVDRDEVYHFFNILASHG